MPGRSPPHRHAMSATETPTLLVADHAPAAGGATLVLQLAGHLAAVAGGAEVIDLAPLETAHVREIVADYVSPDVVDVVTEEVERRSGGWPGAVHDAAIDAAREARHAQGRGRGCSHRSIDVPACQRQGGTR